MTDLTVRSHLRSVLILLTLFVATGCAHGTITPVSLNEVRVSGTVGSVTVVAAPTISPERFSVYQEMSGDELITNQVASELSKRGLLDPSGDLAIEVKIDSFRLRSTSNAVWNGIIAGVDKLGGNVLVNRVGHEPVSYAFKLSGWEDGYMKYSSTARFESLARELGRKIESIISD